MVAIKSIPHNEDGDGWWLKAKTGHLKPRCRNWVVEGGQGSGSHSQVLKRSGLDGGTGGL